MDVQQYNLKEISEAFFKLDELAHGYSLKMDAILYQFSCQLGHELNKRVNFLENKRNNNNEENNNE